MAIDRGLELRLADRGITLNDVYLIWSNEHNGWWGPRECGYVSGLQGAGEYTRDEAILICRRALLSATHVKRIAEIPVRRQDVMDTLDKAEHIPKAVWVGND